MNSPGMIVSLEAEPWLHEDQFGSLLKGLADNHVD